MGKIKMKKKLRQKMKGKDKHFSRVEAFLLLLKDL
jgi:hypothetical protein